MPSDFIPLMLFKIFYSKLMIPFLTRYALLLYNMAYTVLLKASHLTITAFAAI